MSPWRADGDNAEVLLRSLYCLPERYKRRCAFAVWFVLTSLPETEGHWRHAQLSGHGGLREPPASPIPHQPLGPRSWFWSRVVAKELNHTRHAADGWGKSSDFPVPDRPFPDADPLRGLPPRQAEVEPAPLHVVTYVLNFPGVSGWPPARPKGGPAKRQTHAQIAAGRSTLHYRTLKRARGRVDHQRHRDDPIVAGRLLGT
jgi:hypothetical protein